MIESVANSGGVCICVVFNHPFVANIPLLRRLYAGRFSTVRFLVPFQLSDDDDILTVYRGSFGHCAYAIEHIPALESLNCDHYVFVHDDVLLSPYLNEGNIRERLGLRPNEGWVGAIRPTPPDIGEWGYQLGSVWRLIEPRSPLSGVGLDSLAATLRHLPPASEAARKAATYGIPPVTSFHYDGGFPFGGLGHPVAEALFARYGPTIEIPYPIACSGPDADFLIVPRKGLREYLHVAAVLATAGLFVEMAAPTALYLTCDHVRTCADVAMYAEWSLRMIWPRDALSRLLERPELISVHPVKLSVLCDPDRFVSCFDSDGAGATAIARGDFQSLVEAEYPDFDAEFYIASHSDLAAVPTPPYEHYYRFGIQEGRKRSADAA